ncbi:transposase [Elysia marginata]|uniref:Transposase n=1 Tax=Elysia marginata TaxID=1093978 RepID=A0AAV4EJ06_9GAST|nr:transposase [Elysia marginata]
MKIFHYHYPFYDVTKTCGEQLCSNQDEFTKENMRFYIFMRCKLDESTKLIDQTLQTVCGDCACSYQTVRLWVKEFNKGKESLSDCPRRGRPKLCVNEHTIASIKKDIDEDPHISVRELKRHQWPFVWYSSYHHK